MNYDYVSAFFHRRSFAVTALSFSLRPAVGIFARASTRQLIRTHFKPLIGMPLAVPVCCATDVPLSSLFPFHVP